ncbi:hypothetical protein IWX50DRAFT_658201 [Phyllosticta citricarpa]
MSQSASPPQTQIPDITQSAMSTSIREIEKRLEKLEEERHDESCEQESKIRDLEWELKEKDNHIARLKDELAELKCPNLYFNGDRKVYGHWKECLLAKIDEDPEWFNSEDRKISHLMQHVTGLAFDVLSKKYCHSARQKAKESHEIPTFQAALSELDFTFRRVDPYEATAEMQELHMAETEDFPDYFPKFMALINRGAYTSPRNPEQVDDVVALTELMFSIDDWHLRHTVPSRLSPGFTFKEYVEECFQFTYFRKISPWNSQTPSPTASAPGSPDQMAKDAAE